MNPAKSVHAAPQRTNRLMQDVTKPTASQTDGLLATKIVGKIPVKNQAGAAGGLGASDVDDELDKIMRDVGHNLKNADKKPAKRHWFSSKHQASPKAPAKPIVAAVAKPPAPVPAPVKPVAQAAAQPAKKLQPSHSAPGVAIFLAILVTGVLITAAIFTYKS